MHKKHIQDPVSVRLGEKEDVLKKRTQSHCHYGYAGTSSLISSAGRLRHPNFLCGIVRMSRILRPKRPAVEYASVFESNLSDYQFDPLYFGRVPGFFKGSFDELI